MSASGARVLVVGAGIVGRSLAYYLSCSGARPVLLEAAAGPSDASRASLGVLTHFSGGSSSYALFYRDSHALHKKLAAELKDKTGIDVGWCAPGGIDLILDDADEERAESLLQSGRERGIAVQRLDGQQVRDAECLLAVPARGGAFFPGDERVAPLALGDALLRAAQARGAELHYGESLEQIVTSSDGGVEVQTSRRLLGADFLVLACGAWAAELARQLGAKLTVRPIRGQHARYEGGAPQHILRQGGRLLVPEAGDCVVGATVEETGFVVETTDAAAREFADVRARLLGGTAKPVAQRAGLRSKAKSGRPLIGPLNEHPRVFVAAGHYKNGVLMGPHTGQVLTRWMLEGQPGRDMAPFAPER